MASFESNFADTQECDILLPGLFQDA